jgi:hypothetical protein
MTKQKTITLNLTIQEAECLSIVFSDYCKSTWVSMKEVKACHPFLEKLKEKISKNKKPIS